MSEYDYWHGFGRIQGKGNKYSHKINDIILDHMVNEEIDDEWKSTDTDTDEWGIHKWDHRYKPHSLSDIAEVVRKGMKKNFLGKRKKRIVSWDTIRGHMDDLKDAKWVEEDPKRGSNNERNFFLTRLRLNDLDFMRYVFEHMPPPVAITESESP